MIFLKAITGSVLYGTNTPDSDIDYKSVTFPSSMDVLLGNAMDGSHKVTTFVDNTEWTYQKWISLLLKMDSNAVELLFAKPEELNFSMYMPDPKLILHDNRKSAIGFAKSQMSRYGARGQRLESFIKAVDVFKKSKSIEEVYLEIEGLYGVEKVIGPDNVPLLSINGKMVPFTASLKEGYDLYSKIVDTASYRAVNAIGSHDWKGLMHACRILRQMTELVESDDASIVFPLKDRELFLRIRGGEIPYDDVLDIVEKDLEHLQSLDVNSNLATEENANIYGKQLIAKVHRDIVFNDWLREYEYSV